MRQLRIVYVLLLNLLLLTVPDCGAARAANQGFVVDSLPFAGHKRTFSPPSWNLKYKSGSFQLKQEQWLRGAFVPDGSPPKHITPIATILVDQLRAIYFDPKAQKDSDLQQRMSRSGCAYARTLMPKEDSASPPPALIVWIASPGTISRAAERFNPRRPLQLVWSDNGAEKELVLTVNHCEYASFVANLRQFAGQRWHDIGRELPR